MAKFIKKRFPALFVGTYLLIAVAMVGFLVYPALFGQASVANDWTYTEPGNLTVGPSATNVLAVGITLPVNIGGVDSITDTIIAGTGTAGTAGTATFPAGWAFYGYDAAGGGLYNNATDWIGTDDDADGVYTSVADVLYVDGSDSAPSAGTTLYDVVAADNVCSDNSGLALATCIYIDTGGVCGDGTEDTHLLGAAGCDAGGDALVVTGDNWAATDDAIDATTDIYEENVAEELTYSAAADTLVGGVAVAAGSALVNMNSAKPAGWTDLLIIDGGVAGTWEGGPSDLIFTDDDTSGYYNGDQLTSIKIGSPGTCTETDINKITIWEDGANPGWHNGVDETAIGSLTQSGPGTLIGQTITTAGASVYTAGSDAQRIFVTFDTTATPTHGCTFSVGMPTNAAVLVSNNDGPTDAPKAATSTFTVDSSVTVTDGAISIISNGSGLLGVEEYIIGDTLIVEWDDTVDSNGDIASATVNFSAFGGGGAVAMEDDGAGGNCNDGGAADDVWCAAYTIAAGAVDTDGANNLNVSVTANDIYGNTSGAVGDTTGLDCDNVAPTIGTPGTITLADTTGEGVASIGENLTYAGGIPGVADGDSWTTDLSAYAGSATQAPGAWAVIADNDDGAFASTETITDDAGNTATGSVSTLGFTGGPFIDNVAPNITANGTLTITTDHGVGGVAALNDGATNQDKVTQSAVTLAAADGDTTTIDVSALTGEATLAAGAESGVVAPGGLDNAAQTFTITVTDNGGNASTIASDAISVDNVAPTIGAAGTVTLTDTTGEGVASIGENLTYAGGTPGVADGDSWTVDFSAYAGSVTQGPGAWAVVADNDDGAFSANETVTDNGGNIATGAATLVGFANIDNIAPTLATNVASISTDNGVVGWAAVNGGATPADAVNVNATAGAADGDTITWNAVILGGGATQANNTPVTITAGVLDGAHTFNTTITDNAGNTFTGASNAVNVDNDVPAFVTSGLAISLDNGVPGVAAVNGSGVAADAVNVNATVVAPDGDTIIWNALALGGGATQANNTPVTVAVGAVDNPNYNPTVTATDNAGNSIAASTNAIDGTTISLDNILPNVTGAGTLTLTIDVGLEGVASAGDTITYAIGTETTGDGVAWTVDLSTFLLSATQAPGAVVLVPDNDDGIFTPNETVTDNAGNTQAGAPTAVAFPINIDNEIPVLVSATLTISTDNPTPGVANIGDQVDIGAYVETTGDTIAVVNWDATNISGNAAAVRGVPETVAELNVVNPALTVLVNATDDANNVTTAPGLPSTAISVDSQRPTLTGVDEFDMNGDGKIDETVLTFNENIIDANVNPVNFTIGGTAADTVMATTSTNGTDANVANDNVITIKVAAGVSGTEAKAVVYTAGTLTDSAGNPLSTVTFGAGGVTDQAAPVLITTSPANGAVSVPIGDPIVWTFSEPMVATFGTPGQFSSTNDPGGWAATWSGGNTIVSMAHGNYTYGTAVNITTVEGGINAAAGAPTALNVAGAPPVPDDFSFTTLASGGGGGGGGGGYAPTAISLTAPNGSENWDGDSSQNITWIYSGLAIDHVKLLYSLDRGSTFPYVIAEDEANDGTYAWTVPNISSSTAKVKVQAYDYIGNPLVSDISDADFRITAVVPTVSADNSTIAASPTSVVADGTSYSTIDVIVKDTADALVSGKTVTLASSRGTQDTITTVTGTTGTDGKATFTVSSSTAGTSTYTATINGTVLTETASVVFTSPEEPTEVPPGEVPVGLKVGDLIKSSLSSSVYYYGSDNKRHVFPNEKTYKSWYPDWSGIKVIPASQLQGLPLGHNVTVRSGTVLVKIETDPKVYAVEPGGVLRWIPTEARANTLYGDAWATKIIDVPLVFWGDYVFGDDITTDAHPTGALVKYTGMTETYYIQGAEKRLIATESAFNVNRFQWAHVLTIPATLYYANGANITGAETALVQIY